MIYSGANEEVQSGNITIGENASPDSPYEDREFCFPIIVEEDMIKEDREIFTLILTSDDDCVCLGRDGAIVNVLANGSEFEKRSEFESRSSGRLPSLL